MAKTKVNEFDLRKHNYEVRKVEPPNRDGSEFCYLPMGTQMAVQLFRKVEHKPGHNPPKRIKLESVGHTLVVDSYTFGVKVYIKRDKNRLVVFLEDANTDKPQVIAEYTR